ncbi:MAG: ferrous iron transport protein B [Treponema sp.]|nr:ferrous iron transport protein B [Treponema sp.]
MKLTIALIGNQNCGKSTLFNQLTGSKQHVGNFPGVTVEKKSGLIKHQFVHPQDNIHKIQVELVDLPGIYSLSPYTPEEILTRDFLINEKIDAVINIVDATNLERNLYLTLQLMEMQLPMVLALNMMDEVLNAGNSINVEKLSSMLGIDVVPIVANKGDGITELSQITIENALKNKVPSKTDFCEVGSAYHKAIHAIAHLIENNAQKAKIPLRFAATKLVEGDEIILKKLSLNKNETDILEHITTEMESELETDREAALADMRYAFIEKCTKLAVNKVSETKEQLRSVKIDKVLTHRIFSIPIFIAIMAIIFYLTFNIIGGTLSDWLTIIIDTFTAFVDNALTKINLAPPVHSLIINGIFAGVGSVLSFLPFIIVLFFFLSLLEDSGYMARIAFVMDGFLRKIGLSGKSIVPMLIGFGCSVPAIMATRTLNSRRDKRLTIFITPFMSCSAKLPVYALLSAAFFPGKEVIVMICLYLGGIIVAILSALLLKKTIFTGKPIPFVMELPAYRMPTAKTLALHLWEKARDFLKKAFTVIFMATIIIWFLQTFNFRFEMIEDSGTSILAAFGKVISPVFKPLGFDDWRLSTALITGLSAKEVVVSTLAVLTGTGAELSGSAGLQNALSSMMSPQAALAYLVFILLYMPCVATLAVTKRELGTKLAIFAVTFQTVTAWIVAFFVHLVANFF